MSWMIRILRAVHCRSTHHYFALDALAHIDTVPGQQLSRLLLQHYHAYLAGAKAPDTTFRDFQNHVVHVADGNWGGAPQACEKWLKQAIEHLDRKQWKQAAFACGVLSHYFTDPLMPLHTGQTERESVVHRPLEWSVFKSYEAIVETMRARQLQANIQFAHTPDWISKAVLAGASLAHQHYHRLLEIYNLEQGTRSPAAGLDAEAHGILAELFSVAHTGWAQVLCRIADSTTSTIPQHSLTLASLLATIDVPLAWVLKKFSDAKERQAIAALYNEFATTGTVRENLPVEVKLVQSQRALINSPHSGPGRRLDAIVMPASATASLKAPTPSTSQPARSLATAVASVTALTEEAPLPSRPINCTETSTETHAETTSENYVGTGREISPETRVEQLPDNPPEHRCENASERFERQLRRKFLDGYSPLVDAPSIGPKTAKRFEKIGIKTIGDFLAAEPADMALRLATRWVTVELLSEWQCQARLVCEVPSLHGFEAQLLVSVNCRSGADLAARDPQGLFNRITAIVPTSDGARILRNSPAPVLDDVIGWVDAAQHARPFSHRRRSA